MAKFRKIAVLVEAVPVSELVANAASNWNALPDWVKERYEKGGFVFLNDGISTKDWKAGYGDMLIKGAQGEIYPCRPDIFEQEYERADIVRVPYRMTFGEAIELLKRGKRVAREGWNGKNMYLWLKQPVTIKKEWCKDPMLLEAINSCGDSGEIEALGTICMKTTDNKVLTGWLASQTDMLAEDWMMVE
ncbi:MAG: DUF2829 domain-containing protein [Prevotella sp.]|jgi:hypothetical protein|nr:DUF2829 domain-containing protein [Prevotella sp.]